MRRAGLLSLLALGAGCAGTPRGSSALHEAATASTTAPAPPAPAPVTPIGAQPLPLLPAPNGPCMVRGSAEIGSVAWPLRTRLDAIPTLAIESGVVVAELRSTTGRDRAPHALVDVKNERMSLRAMVGVGDVRVVLTKSVEAPPGHYLDGWTFREVAKIEGDHALVDIDTPGAVSTITSLPCAELGVMPNDVHTEALLPKARGSVVVKEDAHVKTPSDWVPVRSFWFPYGAEEPKGQLGELRGDDKDPTERLVSFRICGATILGWVPTRELLGKPVLEHGSSAQCPNGPPGIYVKRNHLQKPRSCERKLDVFVRSDTLEDLVGVIEAGAGFEVVGEEKSGTTLVRVEGPPAEPINGASFSVRTAELEACGR